jgi:hypothetical protein
LYSATLEDPGQSEDASKDFCEMFKEMSLWHDLPIQQEQMLTTYASVITPTPSTNVLVSVRFDIALRCEEMFSDDSRSQFLTQSLLSGPRGYQAMTQGLITVEMLIKQASWHNSIISVLRHFLPDMSEQPQENFDALGSYGLTSSDERSAQSLRWESEAREQLALDLALSTHVFSTTPLKLTESPIDAFDTMSRAAEALSLADEPPPIDFHYLHPAEQVEESDESMDDKVGGAPGVRLLLQEWKMGTGPQDYVYIDPYSDPDQLIKPTRHVKARSSPGRHQPPSQSQRPPMILTATSGAPVTVTDMERRIVHGGMSQGDPNTERYLRSAAASQGVTEYDTMASSQDYMASTQILPGPYGGRATKTKAAKKRVSGF